MQLHTNSLFPEVEPTVRLADLLGSGSNATVFRAQRVTPQDTQMVAVKIPNASVSLATEVAALKRFPHPNIVRLIDEQVSGTGTESTASIVIELCDGGTVEDRILTQPLTPGEVHMIVSSIGAALRSIHAAGWIHGDVNPSNIALRSSDLPCLIDFGTCRPSNSATPTEGTDGFTSPALPSSPILDVRGLIATALAALNPSTAQHLTARLSDLLLRCDRGESVSIEMLTSEFSDIPVEHVQRFSPHASRQLPTRAGGPAAPRTRQFGPRPGGDPTPMTEPQPSRTSLPRVAAIAVIALLAVFIGLDVVGSSNTADALDTEPPEVTNGNRLAAAATLSAADASWTTDGGNMVLTHEARGRFLAGNEGDWAAIADWNCDGEPTLGVFRPSTGAWFVFQSWDADAVSDVEIITDAAAPGTRTALWVEIDAAQCARPIVA